MRKPRRTGLTSDGARGALLVASALALGGTGVAVVSCVDDSSSGPPAGTDASGGPDTGASRFDAGGSHDAASDAHDATVADATADANDANDAAIGVDAADSALPVDAGPDATEDAADGAVDLDAGNDAADASPDADTDAAACTAGILAYYALDEDGGTVIHDGSGNGHDGTTTAAWAPGKKGTALAFDGTTSAIVPAADDFRYGDGDCDFSVEYWVQVTADSTGEYRSVFHHGNTDLERTSGQWLDPAQLLLRGAISTTASYNEVAVSGTFAKSTWVFFTVLKRGSAHEVWMNGVLYASTPLGGPSVGNRGPLYLGKDPVWPGMTGLLDEVRVYQGALSQQQIQNDMQ